MKRQPTDPQPPRGARAILEARAGGLRPADSIVVSYVGSHPWPNPTVYADSGKRYDWRFAMGLHVAIVTKPGVDAGDALRAISSQPRRVEDPLPLLVDVEAEEVACVLPGPRLWRYVKHSAPWQEVFA